MRPSIAAIHRLLFFCFFLFLFFLGQNDGTETEEAKDLGEPQPTETGHSGMEKPGKDKGKILYLADALGTHYNFALNMVNMLAEDGYKVTFVVAVYDKTRKLKAPENSNRVNFIQVPFEGDEVYNAEIARLPMAPATDWGAGQMGMAWEKVMTSMFNYQMFSFYKAIVENPAVDVGEGRPVPILDWLRAQMADPSRRFDLGMAEMCISAGPFPVFHELGLRRYVATSAAPTFPAFLHFLGQKIATSVPERASAAPGDGKGTPGTKGSIRDPKSERHADNVAEYRRTIAAFNRQYNHEHKVLFELAKRRSPVADLKQQMPGLGYLLRGASFFLVNNHQVAHFPVELSDRIKHIGGIEVETSGVIGRKFEEGGERNGSWAETAEDKWLQETDCLVIFTLGTMIKFEQFSPEMGSAMCQAFQRHPECRFLVRMNLEKRPAECAKAANVQFRSDQQLIKQQQILAQRNVRGFVSHCGQNSLNEAIYAGVPIICIPFFGDQHLNAALVEYMGTGVWVLKEKFIEQFPNAMDALLQVAEAKKLSAYAEIAAEYGRAIHQKSQKQTRHFLATIREAMAETDRPEGTSPFPAFEEEKIEFVDTQIAPFAKVLQQFGTKIAETGKYNLIYTPFPWHLGMHQYHFDGVFEDFRVDMLRDIFKENGSVQSNDVLEFKEFSKIENPEFPAEIREKFKEKVQSLRKKLATFLRENPRVGEFHTDLEWRVHFEAEARELKLLQSRVIEEERFPLHGLVMTSKQFMAELISEQGEGSWLDVFTFMNSGEAEFTPLKYIFQLSRLQSVSMDHWVNRWLLGQHNQRAENAAERMGNKALGRVLVEGAGPVGLYATLKMFAAGLRVTLVNDRPETYERNRMVFLDAKWMAQLRLFLGTIYDEVFVDPKGPGQVNYFFEAGQLNVKYIEGAMHRRLVMLKEFVNDSTKLELLYNTSLDDVAAPTHENPDFLAVVGMPDKQKKSIQNAINTEVHRQMTIGREHLKKSGISRLEAQQLATANVAGKELQSPAHAGVPFDLLVLAGGANDRIRDKELGPPKQLTIPKNYGTVIYNKENFGKFIFDQQTFFFREPMHRMRPFLVNEEFEAFIARSKLPKRLKQKYANMLELMVEGLVPVEEPQNGGGQRADEGPLYQMDSANRRFRVGAPQTPVLLVRLFENKPSLHIASITAPAVEELLREVEMEKAALGRQLEKAERELGGLQGDRVKKRKAMELAKQRIAELVDFRIRFERKWSAAIFYFAYHNAHPDRAAKKLYIVNMDPEGNANVRNPAEIPSHSTLLHIDPFPFNTSTFNVIIQSAMEPVKAMPNEMKEGLGAVVAAVGDANCSPHFMTASGLSTGRMGVDHTARLVMEYNLAEGEFKENRDIDVGKLATALAKPLKSLKRRVLKKVLDYVEPVRENSGNRFLDDKEASTNKHSLIFYLFPGAIYKFNGLFPSWRIKQLQVVVDQGGSVQSNDVLEWDEFSALTALDPKYKRRLAPTNEGHEKLVKLAEVFSAKVNSLEEKVKQFGQKHDKLLDGLIDAVAFKKEMENGESALHDLVIECKQFMRRLMSEEGEGSWLDVFSFMRAPDHRFLALQNAFELSKMQSKRLDELINEAMLHEHLANQPPPGAAQPMARAVVEGAGPAGLLSAYHLFLAGMRLLLVNDRPENYARSRIMYMDPKWMCQLRFFLGTRFDEMFLAAKALAQIYPGEVGVVVCRYLEDTLRYRLVELASYVEEEEKKMNEKDPPAGEEEAENEASQIGGELARVGGEDLKKVDRRPPRLELRFETAFVRIAEPTAKSHSFLAILETPKRHGNPAAAEFNAELAKRNPLGAKGIIQAKEEQLAEQRRMIKQSHREMPATEGQQTAAVDDSSNLLLEHQPYGKHGPTRQISAQEWAQKEFRGEVLQLRAHAPEPLDLLVCAGGANDLVRDHYLGKPAPRIVPRSNGVVVFRKGKFGQRIFHSEVIFIDDKNMWHMKAHLEARKLDAVVASAEFLSAQLRAKYSNLVELLAGELVEARPNRQEAKRKLKQRNFRKQYLMDGSRFKVMPRNRFNAVKQPIRVFENRQSILITSIPPAALDEFLLDLEAEKGATAWEQQAKFADFHKRFERIWSAALLDLALEAVHRTAIRLNMHENGEIPLPKSKEEEEEEEENVLNFDADPVNTFIFYQTVLAVPDPVKELASPVDASQPPAIVMAVGDANSSPHTFTASGLSTGRLGIEKVAYLIRDFHLALGHTESTRDAVRQLAQQIRQVLNSVKEMVLTKATEYAKVLPDKNWTAKKIEKAEEKEEDKEEDGEKSAEAA